MKRTWQGDYGKLIGVTEATNSTNVTKPTSLADMNYRKLEEEVVVPGDQTTENLASDVEGDKVKTMVMTTPKSQAKISVTVDDE